MEHLKACSLEQSARFGERWGLTGEKVRTLKLNGPPLNGTRKAKMS